MLTKILPLYLLVILANYSITMKKGDFRPRVKYYREELEERLDEMTWYVTQTGAVEWPYPGFFRDYWEKGIYHCAVCDEKVFSSEHKYDTGKDGPSFYKGIDENIVEIDFNLFKQIDFVHCANCGAHLGHLF